MLCLFRNTSFDRVSLQKGIIEEPFKPSSNSSNSLFWRHVVFLMRKDFTNQRKLRLYLWNGVNFIGIWYSLFPFFTILIQNAGWFLCMIKANSKTGSTLCKCLIWPNTFSISVLFLARVFKGIQPINFLENHDLVSESLLLYQDKLVGK